MRKAFLAIAIFGAAAGCSSSPEGDASVGSEALTSRVSGVTFKTQLGENFVGAQNGGGGNVVATATVAQGWETFTLLDQNGGTLQSGDEVFVQTGNGDYFQAANGGGSTLNAASHNEKGWETFRVVKASGSGAIANGDAVGLQAVTAGTWVSAQNGGGGSVFAYGASLGTWEKMIIGLPAASAPPPPPPPPADAGPGGGASGGFQHPGVLVNRAQLDFVKAQVASSASPWKGAFNEASGSSQASLSYQPTPIATVECGPYSNPDVGCSNEKNDASAAYTQALLWYLTGNAAHAETAIRIMNAWSSTVVAHTNSNAPLQSAWVASVWPRAAEIIRYTYTGWASADVTRFANMLKNVYLPEVVNGSDSNGNWELSMAEATIGIAVFLDDHTTFDKAVSMWRKRVPAYIYLSSDGALPVPPPSGNKTSQAALVGFWYNQSTFVDGLSQETCRDLGHVQYGFAAMTNAAETARIQGVDLFQEQAARITAGYEFHAGFLNGNAVPSWLCGGALNAKSPDPMWEIGYNEYANREGLSLPQNQKLLAKIRPTGADHHMIWETLTHAEVGSVGIP
jgi:hypothetical protein